MNLIYCGDNSNMKLVVTLATGPELKVQNSTQLCLCLSQQVNIFIFNSKAMEHKSTGAHYTLISLQFNVKSMAKQYHRLFYCRVGKTFDGHSMLPFST